MNLYETVTARILNQLAAGQVPWRKTWKTGLPKSLSTGREYRGVNILVLGSAEYTSRYWMTFREAQRQGGHVRKGERATPVIYWKWRTPEEIAQRAEQTGKEDVAPCTPFVNAVFNLEQVEGVTRPDASVIARPSTMATALASISKLILSRSTASAPSPSASLSWSKVSTSTSILTRCPTPARARRSAGATPPAIAT